MVFPSVRHKLDRLLEQEHPVRFLSARILWRTGLCRRLIIQMPGYRLHFHPSAISTALWENPNFRREDVEILGRILRPGDTYVDVGANVGHLAIMAAGRVGPSGAVLALEAHPRTYGFLRENCALNGLTWLDTRNTAVGAAPGRVSFTDMVLDDQNFVVAGTDGGVSVDVKTLDELAPNGPIKVLKIDVEGFELQVLAGGAGTLSRCACVYIEESQSNLARYGAAPEDLRRKLKSSGFDLFRYEGGDLYDPPPASATTATNLLAIRPGALSEVRDHLRRP